MKWLYLPPEVVVQEAFAEFFLVILWVGETKKNNGENSEEAEIIEKKQFLLWTVISSKVPPFYEQ